MNLKDIANNIEKRQNGIYFAKTASPISYPEEDNAKCYQIEQDSFWFNHRNKVIIEGIKKYSPQKTFFDIGGGNGFVAKGLQDEGIDVVLIEPGVQGAVNARSRNLENVVCSTLQDAQFKKSSLDSIGMFDVVEHIEDDHQFMKDAHLYLKKEGYIYITVPAFNFLWSNEDNDAGHYRRYTLPKLNELLTKSGFQVEYSTYIFSILPLPVLLFRSIPSRLGIHKNSDNIDKYKKEHSNNKGLVKNVLDKIWNWELNRVKNSKKIGIGGSCFMIAKKV